MPRHRTHGRCVVTDSVMILRAVFADIWTWTTRYGLPVVVFIGGLSLALATYHHILRGKKS